MNQSFGSQNQMPANPPSVNPPSAGQPPVAPPSNPFEAPAPPPPPASAAPMPSVQNVPIVTSQPPNQPPNQPPTPTNNGLDQMFQPTGSEPSHGGRKAWVLIVILLVVLVLGGLFFASWMGWISLGGIEKYWKKTATTTETTAPTPTSNVNVNDKQRKADLASLKTALKAYYQANQAYPVTATSQKTSDTENALNVLVPTYIAKLPVDPFPSSYYYGYQSDGKTFQLTAVLEDTTDPAGIQSGSYFLYKVTDVSTETPTTSTETETPAAPTETPAQ